LTPDKTVVVATPTPITAVVACKTPKLVCIALIPFNVAVWQKELKKIQNKWFINKDRSIIFLIKL
jgi:hypothetical protein